MSVLSVENLHVTLNGHNVLKGVSFEIGKGEIAAIIGPNGSGKTTLLKAALGLIPYSGNISLLGMPPSSIKKISGKIGYVPQRLDFDRTMPVTVSELLSIHNKSHETEESRGKTDIMNRTLSLARTEHLLKKRLGVLSGGEFQRVLLSLALLNRPEVLFLDEPVASVDIEGAGEMYALLKELREREGITVVLVSHDVDIVFRYATTVLCINHELICHGAPHAAMTRENLEKLYGREYDLYAHKEKRHTHEHHD
ncbi:metal ABC transporter ATP-binding protein [bacterium]|nr:metal ABC transporter ATP-binding protein [bacterium]MCI0565912.1 metal ABC transporter ATP-binding protein [bacterium]MCI0679711.1 metal ABC transporter ATP-binding protein [bacterium]